MPKIEFHARDTSTGKEFVCERCSGEMVKPAAKLYARQRPYAMECKKCGLVSGSWGTDEERSQFLEEMPAS
jgi:transcription elongation factor Elf1